MWAHEDGNWEGRQSHRSGCAMPIRVRNEPYKSRHDLVELLDTNDKGRTFAGSGLVVSRDGGDRSGHRVGALVIRLVG